MDLTKTTPRGPNEKLAGLVSLARTIDKAKAFNEGHLGEYDYDCPHDRPLFEFLGTDGATFAAKVKELDGDDAIVAWLRSGTKLGQKPATEIDAFNTGRRHWHPDPGSHSEEYFVGLRDRVAPGRPEIVTWFDLLDLDEGRAVTSPTKLQAAT